MLKITCQGASAEFWKEIKSSEVWSGLGKIEFSNTSFENSDINFVFDYIGSKSDLPGKKNILVILEPRSVNPFQYQQKNLKKFDLVVAGSKIRAKTLGLSDYINCPIKFLPGLKDINKKNLDYVILNANKFSANSHSLYGVRRKFSRYLFSSRQSYALFGLDWHMSKKKEVRERIWAIRKEIMTFSKPDIKEACSDFLYKYPEYRGAPVNKQEILKDAKFAVIVENEGDYISEKVFDAIFSGCVPIYVGPNLSEYESLSRCVVQIGSNVKSLSEFIQNYSEDIYQEKISNIMSAINNSDSFSEFSFKVNVDKLVALVRNKLID